MGGHPLIAWTIRAAQLSTLLTDWLVSSEDPEILAVARSYGAPTPFVRPADLAGDEVRNIDTVRHALEFMEDDTGRSYDLIVLLQPTSPIRSPAHIDEAVRLLWASPLETLASVKGPFQKRDPILKRIRNGVLEPYCQASGHDQREPMYVYNAAIYAVKRDYFLNHGKLVSDRQVPFVLDEFHSADIDNESDLIVADAYLRYLGDRGVEPVKEEFK